MLQRCSTVCGTEGKDLHADDITAAAVDTLPAAKADGRQQLHTAGSAAAARLPATRLRGLQVCLDSLAYPEASHSVSLLVRPSLLSSESLQVSEMHLYLRNVCMSMSRQGCRQSHGTVNKHEQRNGVRMLVEWLQGQQPQ